LRIFIFIFSGDSAEYWNDSNKGELSLRNFTFDNSGETAEAVTERPKTGHGHRGCTPFLKEIGETEKHSLSNSPGGEFENHYSHDESTQLVGRRRSDGVQSDQFMVDILRLDSNGEEIISSQTPGKQSPSRKSSMQRNISSSGDHPVSSHNDNVLDLHGGETYRLALQPFPPPAIRPTTSGEQKMQRRRSSITIGQFLLCYHY